MSVRNDLFPVRIVATAFVLGVVASCGGDAPADRPSGEEGGGVEASAAPSGVDPALALSPDPVDRMNFLLAKAVRAVPGEPYEVRYQLRRVGSDTLVVEYQQRRVGEAWPPPPAWAVGVLGTFTAEIEQGRGVQLSCEERACLEYQVPLDTLDLARLPRGAEGDWFRDLLQALASGASVDEYGGEDVVNRRLKESALHYSETVRTWYQVEFEGRRMALWIWQQTQGFPENRLPSARRVDLDQLGSRTQDGHFLCKTSGCVLDVERTPWRVVLENPEDAESFVALLNGLAGA